MVMDTKRKANSNAAATMELYDRAAKRRKLPSVNLLNRETAETTTEYGIPFLEQVRKTADKSGRLVATNFLTLPSKKDLPDYYKVIKMPIALDTIQEKLTRREFPNLTSLESYCKRMISNAKEYNQKGSEIYDDAERIRKALSNFMTKNNPAYRAPGYVAVPTPLPRDLPVEEDDDAVGNEEGGEELDKKKSTPAPSKKRANRASRSAPLNNHANSGRSSATPSLITDTQYGKLEFQGLNFQQAQEKLISDIISYKEDENDKFPAFEPFVDLPSRSLRDYYQLIAYPISLRGIQKRIKGIHGRSGQTGISDFKSWKSLEEEIEHVWENAWQYNEDGSDIAILAKELKFFFNKQLMQAKKHVQEPAQHKLKLKMSTATEPTPKITLRMPGKSNPADSSITPASLNGRAASPQNGGSVLKRNSFGNTSKTAAAAPTLEQLDRARSFSGSAASPTPSTSGMVKNEDAIKNSPSIPPVTPSVNGLHRQSSTAQINGHSMLPPSNLVPGISGISLLSSTIQTPSHISTTQAYHAHNPNLESKWRQPGKDASDAMITNLSIATHPGLNIPLHFRMDVPPSSTMTQQSMTISLPPTHYSLQIKPTLAPALLDRQYKLFVTAGTTRLNNGQLINQLNPVFDVRLLPGVNRVEVELVAALAKGMQRPVVGGVGSGGVLDFEQEKITVFANLLR